MKPEIRHIVFDIGQVLLHWDPELGFIDLIPDASERRWFLDNVCTHDWNLEQDRGRPWPEAEAEAISRHPDQKRRIQAFRQNWHKMVPHAYPESVDILETFVDEGHDVTLLTNFAGDTLQEARKRFGFLNRARGATVSGEVGLLKPDPAIYQSHVRSFDLSPRYCLFIDDSPANVAGAKAVGWQSVHFSTPDKLREDLAKFDFVAPR